ncbi:hypothetical protein BS47DRAFT_443948 [Hydnum rufescens UP504]|uniref:Uncharacterized protein n=1 Tax=Hydnum rufescens UP504 TaxID=1448309 RepID=A0A9P6B4Y9_9AGAM|nr:hypothetical protein BS47DRAFT_443948 [Hydnum rufescens UP504]
MPPFMFLRLRSEGKSPRAALDAIKHAFAALFTATGLVTAAAGTSYFAFKWTTGISDIHEFTQFMRKAVANTVPPRLNSRLNAPDAPPHDLPMHSGDNRVPVNSNSQMERRLQAAYEAGGMTKWYEQVLVEFEREWEGQTTDSEGTTVYKAELNNNK